MSDTSESHQDDYSIRDDQMAAMEELDRLQKTNADEWDEEKDAEFLQLLMEPGPDYEETLARLDQLNADLERQASPEEADMRRLPKVRFSEELILVAPSPPPEDEEEEAMDEEEAEGEMEAEPEEPTTGQAVPPEADGSGKVVLVGDDRHFSYVSSQEVEAVAGGSASVSDSSSGVNGNDNGVSRPESAASASSQSRRQRPGTGRRPGSSAGRNGHNGSCHEGERDNELAFQAWLSSKQRQKRQERRQRKQRELEDAEEREQARRSENGTGFQKWLRAKYRQERDERERKEASKEKEEQDRQQSKEKAKEEAPSFEDWLRAKRKQWGLERKLQAKELEEMAEGREVHTSKQCHKAFKQWLRRKEEQKRYEELCDQQRARITNLAMRRSRKSQALANALLVASSYRYMDYYGYR